MKRVLIAVLLVSSACLPAAAQEDDRFVQAEGEPPPGELQDANAAAWAVDVLPAFDGPLRLPERRAADVIYVYREGIIGIGARVDEALRRQPMPIAELAHLRLFVPFWATLDVTGAQNAHGVNAVYALVEPGRILITWHEVLPAGFGPLSQPMSFSVQIEQAPDGPLVLEYRYLDPPATGQYAPRAGFVVGEPVELFRRPEADEEAFSVPADRAKALFEQGSDDEAGVWRFEIGADGRLLGDQDQDGIRDAFDNCFRDPNPLQSNLDGDAEGDACDTDDDGDTVRDLFDNCPRHADVTQRDLDRDGRGDVCDGDRDGDRVSNGTDNCPDTYQIRQHDLDADGMGDACDADIDGDDAGSLLRLGRVVRDLCPGVYDPIRKDTDRDGLGDACDLAPRWACRLGRCAEQSDWDGDGVGDMTDVCPYWPDPDQRVDKDGQGLACARLIQPRAPVPIDWRELLFVPRFLPIP